MASMELGIIKGIAVAVVLGAGMCVSAGSAAGAGPESKSGSKEWQFAPAGDFYPVYLADPRRPQSAIVLMNMIDSEIHGGGNIRWSTRLGGRFPLVRRHPAGDPDTGFQLDFEAGIFAHFDTTHGDDNIGWDGVFGLLLSYRPRPEIGLRFGLQHDSAHVGDEYTERMGRQRINYTRQEVVLGGSRQFAPAWRGYLEAGHGFSDTEDFHEPLRFQGGLEYVSPRSWRDGQARWYAAVDLTSFEERDYKVTPTAQLGLVFPSRHTSGRYRLALEYGIGRSALGEFSFRDESYLALGYYYDF
jgi:hypothetical protein